jgi:hypothetical protein
VTRGGNPTAAWCGEVGLDDEGVATWSERLGEPPPTLLFVVPFVFAKGGPADNERPGKGSSTKGVGSEVIAAGAEMECGIPRGGSAGGEAGWRGGTISVRRDPMSNHTCAICHRPASYAVYHKHKQTMSSTCRKGRRGREENSHPRSLHKQPSDPVLQTRTPLRA